MKFIFSLLSTPWVVLVAFLSMVPFTASSQDTNPCAENLKNAQALFDKGQVGQVPVVLGECLKSGFTREDELAAFKLLIQTFLFEDKLTEADSTMLAFLRKNPEYELSPTDHSSFVYLYNTFRVKPVLQLTVRFGTNLPFVTFVDQESAAGIPGLNKYTSPALNLYASLESKIELTSQLELNVEAGFSQIRFTNTEEILGFSLSSYNENQSRIEIPVTVTYDLKSFGRFTPYGRIGLGPALLLGATARAETNATDLNNNDDHTGTSLDLMDSRITMDMFIQAGAGVKLKTRGGFIVAELRLNTGILNQTAGGGGSFGERGFFYYNVHDDFHLNTLNFSLGYTHIFYRPSKIK